MVKKRIKSCFLKLNLPDVTGKNLARVLANETRRSARERLRAVQLVLNGKEPKHAARMVRASETSVLRWIAIARRAGLQALLADGRGQKPKLPGIASKAGPMRARLRHALEPPGHDRMTQTRLTAVDQLLAGVSVAEVASAARVTQGAVMVWLAKFEKGGVAALVTRPQRFAPLCPNVDGASLRARAVTVKNPRIARRLRAVAHLADGLSAIEAAARERTNDWMVRRWLAMFREGGVEALLRDNRLKDSA
jgi:transposase